MFKKHTENRCEIRGILYVCNEKRLLIFNDLYDNSSIVINVVYFNSSKLIEGNWSFTLQLLLRSLIFSYI